MTVSSTFALRIVSVVWARWFFIPLIAIWLMRSQRWIWKICPKTRRIPIKNLQLSVRHRDGWIWNNAWIMLLYISGIWFCERRGGTVEIWGRIGWLGTPLWVEGSSWRRLGVTEAWGGRSGRWEGSCLLCLWNVVGSASGISWPVR